MRRRRVLDFRAPTDPDGQLQVFTAGSFWGELKINVAILMQSVMEKTLTRLGACAAALTNPWARALGGLTLAQASPAVGSSPGAERVGCARGSLGRVASP